MGDEAEKHEVSLRSLIEAVVNGEASAEQHRQLEQRLLDDQQARDAWLNYTNLHASLYGWFLAGDWGEPSKDDSSDLPLTILRESLEESRTRRSYVGWLGVTAAVCLLLFAGVYQLPWFRSLFESPIVAGPTIVQLAGDIQIQSTDGRAVNAVHGKSIGLGKTVVSSSAEDRVVLRYADETEIVLLGPSKLTVTGSPRGRKELKLSGGLLQANVAAQPADAPLLIDTPQARVRVLGTRFELSTDDRDGTRLDLESGRVELLRGEEPPVTVESNSIAIVPATPGPIRIDPRPAVVDTPQRETEFRGLKSIAFAEDGETLIAGTGWQALYWYGDNRMEVVPFTPHGRRGINLLQQVDAELVYWDRHEQDVKTWDARLRKSRSLFGDVAKLRRQFGKRPDRPTEWNPVSKLAVASPRADWLAFQVGREFRIWHAGKNRWLGFARNYDGQFVGALASSPDGNTLAVAVRRNKVDLVDVNTGNVTTTWSLQHEVPFAIEFSASGNHLVAGLAHGHVAVHDATTGELIADFEQPGVPFLEVAISAEGRYVAASSLGHRVWMWDVNGRLEFPLLDVGAGIQDLTFAPSRVQLAVLSRGGRLSLWEVQSTSELQAETKIDSQ